MEVPMSCEKCRMKSVGALRVWQKIKTLAKGSCMDPNFTQIELRKIYLPCNIIVDDHVLQQKYEASINGGTKPANVLLQHVNFLAGEENAHLRLHLTHIARSALDDERSLRRGDKTCWSECAPCHANGRAPGVERNFGTAWTEVPNAHVQYLIGQGPLRGGFDQAYTPWDNRGGGARFCSQVAGIQQAGFRVVSSAGGRLQARLGKGSSAAVGGGGPGAAAAVAAAPASSPGAAGGVASGGPPPGAGVGISDSEDDTESVVSLESTPSEPPPLPPPAGPPPGLELEAPPDGPSPSQALRDAPAMQVAEPPAPAASPQEAPEMTMCSCGCGRPVPLCSGPAPQPPVATPAASPVAAAASTPTPASAALALGPGASSASAEIQSSLCATPNGNVARVEKESEIDRQQTCYVNRDQMHSTVVDAPQPKCKANQKKKGLPAPDCAEIGARTADARFPNVCEDLQFLFANDPRCVKSADYMRNIDIGEFKAHPKLVKRLHVVVAMLKKHVFNKEECARTMLEFESHLQSFPSAWSQTKKEETHAEAMNQEGDIRYEQAMTFNRTVEAFVKAEVSAKPKPRPIVNHKEIRQAALAKVAYCFDHTMFRVLQNMSIKNRKKSAVMEDIAWFSGHAFQGDPTHSQPRLRKDRSRYSRYVENDFTSFEFGIGEILKAAEVSILKHVADMIGATDAALDSSRVLFDRCCADRTRTCTWKMTYIDEAGQKCTFTMTQELVVRESGDRLTSSGNFLQNLMAWFVYLCATHHIEAMIISVVTNAGKWFYYVSARNGFVYVACLYFEGDDTVGRLEEARIWTVQQDERQAAAKENRKPQCDIEVFFRNWGFKSKCAFKEQKSFDYYRFVGYDTLLNFGEPVFIGSGQTGRLVMQPDFKRILNTKQWTMQKAERSIMKFSNQMYAVTYAEEFKHNEVAHAFFLSMFMDNQLTPKELVYCGRRMNDSHVRELMMHAGETTVNRESNAYVQAALSDGNLKLPLLEDCSRYDKELSRIAIGPYTDMEWAVASSPISLQVHGADLAQHLPQAWIR